MQNEKMECAADRERTIEILLEKEVDSKLFSGKKQGKAVFEHLSGDGSSRKFIRVSTRMGPICIAVLPPSSGKRDMAEFRAALEIGRHLDSVGTPVPKILAADERIGLILFEDFGDVRLHDIVNSVTKSSSKCHVSPRRPCRRLSLRAYSGPNFRHHCRMVS